MERGCRKSRARGPLGSSGSVPRHASSSRPRRRPIPRCVETYVGLDLNPQPGGLLNMIPLMKQTFGLMDQLRFLEDHCAHNDAVDFSTAVDALYKRLLRLFQDRSVHLRP
jgi:hypothetical protein